MQLGQHHPPHQHFFHHNSSTMSAVLCVTVLPELWCKSIHFERYPKGIEFHESSCIWIKNYKRANYLLLTRSLRVAAALPKHCAWRKVSLSTAFSLECGSACVRSQCMLSVFRARYELFGVGVLFLILVYIWV